MSTMRSVSLELGYHPHMVRAAPVPVPPPLRCRSHRDRICWPMGEKEITLVVITALSPREKAMGGSKTHDNCSRVAVLQIRIELSAKETAIRAPSLSNAAASGLL